jgi:hypothetical protein
MSSLTECGLPGIRQVPYGLHMCSFYGSRDDLVAALVPYFSAGLRSNERCIWVTAAPLDTAAAAQALERAGVDMRGALQKGALEIRDGAATYGEPEALQGKALADAWLREEQRALRDGYSGLRLSGNITFLRAADWPAFMAYEEAVNESVGGRRIVALCTYLLADCGAERMLDVKQRHACTLEHPDEGWQLTTGNA